MVAFGRQQVAVRRSEARRNPQVLREAFIEVAHDPPRRHHRYARRAPLPAQLGGDVCSRGRVDPDIRRHHKGHWARDRPRTRSHVDHNAAPAPRSIHALVDARVLRAARHDADNVRPIYHQTTVHKRDLAVVGFDPQRLDLTRDLTRDLIIDRRQGTRQDEMPHAQGVPTERVRRHLGQRRERPARELEDKGIRVVGGGPPQREHRDVDTTTSDRRAIAP
jgi:hypothetical protein